MRRKLAMIFSTLILLSSTIVTPISVVATSVNKEIDTKITEEAHDGNALPMPESSKFKNSEKETNLTSEELVTDEGSDAEADVNLDEKDETDSKGEEASLEESFEIKHPKVLTAQDVKLEDSLSTTSKKGDKQKIRDANASIITAIRVTNSGGEDITNATQYTIINVMMDFALPDNQFHSGDTVTIGLPKELKFTSDKSFDVKDSEQNIIAKTAVNSQTGIATLTFTDFVEKNSNITGTLAFTTQIVSTQVENSSNIELEFTVDGDVVQGPEIDYELAGDNPDETFSKSGWFIDDEGTKLQYFLRVNPSGQSYTDVTIHDTLKTEGTSFDRESFKLLKGIWKQDEDGVWQLTDSADVTSQYEVEYSDNERSFSIKLGKLNATDQFKLEYQVDTHHESLPDETYINTAVMTDKEEVVEEYTVEEKYESAGGEGAGENYSISIKKIDEQGMSLSGAKFELIRDKNHMKVGEVITNEEGTATFDQLVKDTYTLKETQAPEGYELLNEELQITPKDFESDKPFVLEILNHKLPPKSTSLALEAEKQLTGKPLEADAYAFELRDEKGTVIETAKNNQEGRIQFSALTYDKAEVYHYTIQEVIGEELGVTYDDQVVNVTVTVTDDNGQLVAEVTYESEPSFHNEYAPEKITVTLEAEKQLTGKLLEADAYAFELRDEEGTVIETAKNNQEGFIQFSALTYDKAGVYHYTIQEVIGEELGVTYDDQLVNVTVTVTDDNGQLVAEVAYESEPSFHNEYAPEKTTVTLEAEKQLTGKPLEANAYAFELRDEKGTVIETAKNNQEGRIQFSALTYDKAGVYHYTIQEVIGEELGVTYDDQVVNVTVTVTDDNGQLVTEVAYESEPSFHNEYAPEKTTVTLEAEKQLTGKPLEADAYAFELRDEKGTVIETAKNNQEGFIQFSALTYDKAGVYHYTIQEVIGEELGVTYDDQVVNVTVTVTDDNGQLVTEVAYESEPVFKNSYQQVPGKPSDKPNDSKKIDEKKTTTSHLPQTGETHSQLVYLIGILLLVVVSYLLFKRYWQYKND